MATETSTGAGKSPGRTVVYLARHGQTPLNESDVLRGLADPPVDETGNDQARRLGAALGPRGVCAVIASPLLRARQTARPVADHAGVEVTTDQCLLDRDYGPWTGVSRETVTERFGSVDDAPGVEPRSVLRDRAVNGLIDIAQRNSGGTVVVASNDAVNREVRQLTAQDNGVCGRLAFPAERMTAPLAGLVGYMRDAMAPCRPGRICHRAALVRSACSTCG